MRIYNKRMKTLIGGLDTLFVAGLLSFAVIPFEASAIDLPVMSSTGTNGAKESCFNTAANWTNPAYESVAPNDEAASGYDYVVNSEGLRSPASGTLNVFHSHKFTVTGATFYECMGSGTVTNRFENDGLVLGAGGIISVMSGRYADATYEGKVTINGINEASGQQRSQFKAGSTDGTGKASVLRLAGSLHGSGFLRAAAGGIGARVVIEADADDFSGTCVAAGNDTWLTFGCSVFNGSVERWNLAAIGAERATSVVQIKDLTLNAQLSTLIVPVDSVSRSAGILVVTNSYVWNVSSGESVGKITVQMRGDLPWAGDIPVLKLAPQCKVSKNSGEGSFEEQPVEFGGFVDDMREVRDTSFASKLSNVRMVKYTEADGSRILAVRVTKPGLAIVVR